MKEMFQQILRALEQGEARMLVSIVADRGSAPRGIGARMLVGPCGRISGTVGGGAVELHAEKKALELLQEGRSGLHDFLLHTNSREDIGMVCGGDVKILFRCIPAGDGGWLELSRAFLDRLEQHKPGWLLDRLTEENILPCLYTEERSWGGFLPEPALLQQLRGDSALLIGDCFAEPLPLGERVLIFGGGHVAQKLAPVLQPLGFRSVIFENRADYAQKSLFPTAEKVLLGEYERVDASLQITAEDYVVIMTNGHKHDGVIQAQILSRPHAYLGVIGSKAKIAALNKILLEQGFTQEQLDGVHTPIGLPIKAQTPAEIAISIAAELILVRAERRGANGDMGCPMH
ncbi:MAG: XdhC family protein [Bacillota bacterium]|nr:XdhC family protein [Bacillota bacterium]